MRKSIKKTMEILRKEMVFIILILALCMASNGSAYYKAKECNLITFKSRITQIIKVKKKHECVVCGKKKHVKKVSVKICQKGKYNGRYKSFYECKSCFSWWEKQDGKIKKGTKVLMILDMGSAKKFKNLMIYNVRKEVK